MKGMKITAESYVRNHAGGGAAGAREKHLRLGGCKGVF